LSLLYDENVMGPHPKRASGLEIREVDDGFMIHQPERDRVHYLNHTAVLVLELCNGENSPARISELVGAAYGLAAPPDKEVADVMEKLRDEGLVQ
jgi:hypothetical protein